MAHFGTFWPFFDPFFDPFLTVHFTTPIYFYGCVAIFCIYVKYTVKKVVIKYVTFSNNLSIFTPFLALFYTILLNIATRTYVYYTVNK